MHSHKARSQSISQLSGYTRYTQICDCGARRRVDINGSLKLVSHWIDPEDRDIALARRVVSQRREIAKSIGEPLRMEFMAEADAIERIIERLEEKADGHISS